MLGVNRVSVTVTTHFPRRGLKTLEPPSLRVRDPLDLASVQAVGGGPPQRLLVLPRTERVRWTRPDRGRRFRLADGNAASEAMAAVDVDGLRPYRPGTPASRIHWPAVARGAGLIERRLQADGDSRPMILLDARSDGPEELLDAAVRAAASLTLELARAGGCGLLLPGEQRATAIDRELITWPAAYARLAVVEGGPQAPAPALKSYATRVGPMIYVAAASPGRLPAANGGGRGLTLLVVPVASLSGGRPPGIRGSMLPTLDVSGCRGFLLGVGREVDRPRAERPRGERRVSASAAAPRLTRPGSVVRHARAERPWVRLATFAALSLYGVLRWSTLLHPAPMGRLLGLLALALVIALGIPELRRYFGTPAAIGATLVVSLLAFPLSGLPWHYLTHMRIAVSADRIGTGLQGLAGVLVPYLGNSHTIRLVFVLGAAVLLLDAAIVLAFAPRPFRDGRRATAALPLAALAVVPTALVRPQQPYLQGLLLFVLLAAFMWGERVRSEAVGTAVAVAALAGIAGAVLAPGLDPHKPWVNFRAWAGTVTRPRIDAFDWNQTYGPLHWPHSGHTVLTVEAEHADYWKAEDLDVFNGYAWQSSSNEITGALPAPDPAALQKWTQSVRVTIKGMRTTDIIAAGYASEPAIAQNVVAGTSAGTWTTASPLGPGTSYRVLTYSPMPSAAQLRTAGGGYPASGAEQLSHAQHPRPAGPDPQPAAGDVPAVSLHRAPVRAAVLRPQRHRDGAQLALRRCLPAELGAWRRRRRPRMRSSRACSAISHAASATTRSRRCGATRWRASCSRTGSATASSSRGRWRCCCGWVACRRGWPRASPPAIPPAAMCGRSATSTHTPGLRRGSHTTAGSASIPTPATAPARGGASAAPQAKRVGATGFGNEPGAGQGRRFRGRLGRLAPRVGGLEPESVARHPGGAGAGRPGGVGLVAAAPRAHCRRVGGRARAGTGALRAPACRRRHARLPGAPVPQLAQRRRLHPAPAPEPLRRAATDGPPPCSDAPCASSCAMAWASRGGCGRCGRCRPGWAARAQYAAACALKLHRHG